MKGITTFSIVFLLAACSAPQDQTAQTEAAAARSQPPAGTGPAPSPAPLSDMPASAPMASASGKIEAVDTAAGTVTIAHGPVDALGWPAMTMGFKATPEQITSVQAGQKVHFEFQAQGMEATITQIMPAQ